MANKVLGSLSALLTLNDKDFQQGMKRAKSSVGGFQKSIAGIGAAMAGAFSVAALVAWGKASLQGLDAQQKAEQKLLTALKGRQDVQQELIRDAAELQKRSLFGDEQTIEAYAQLAAFIKNEQALKRLMPLIQDMATAFNMDLSQAAVLVGKSIGSSTNALSRYGIEIKGAVGSTDRLNSAVTALSDKFEGQAYAATQTALGAAVQLQNAWGDFGETLISFVGPALTQLAKGMNEAVSGMDAMVKSKSLSWWDKLRMTLGYASGSVGTVANVVGNNLDPEIENATDSVNQMTQATDDLAGSLDDVGKKAFSAKDGIASMNAALGGFVPDANWYPEQGATSTDNSEENLKGFQDAIGMGEGGTFEEQSQQWQDNLQGMTDALVVWGVEMSNAGDAAEELGNRASTAFEGIGAAMGYAIGEMIEGEKDMGDIVAGLLQSIARIIAGYLAESVAASFAGGASVGGPAAPFTGAAMAGVALSMFAAIVPAFLAEGGVVPGGYPNDSYPAMLTSGEVVAPAHKLESMFGGGSSRVEVVGVIRGEDIHFINQKQASKLNRYR